MHGERLIGMHPILFELGPFAIRSYGVCVALAFVIGFYLLETEAKRSAFYPGKILDMGLWVLVAGILGARLLHVLVNLNYYCANPLEMLLFWRGGLAIYGGLISGILAGIVFVRKNAMPFFLTGDFFVDDIGDDYDLILLSNIIHSLGKDAMTRLFKKSYRALKLGGQIVVKDFILNEDMVSPKNSALFAINMLSVTQEGRCYTYSEIEKLLTDAGFAGFKFSYVNEEDRLVIAKRNDR